jgi:hypothetical protein
MSTNLSTVEQARIGFERSGLPFTPWLTETDSLSEDAFEEQISQVPQNQLPPRLRRELRPSSRQGSNGFGVLAASEVLKAWVQEGRFDGLLMIPGAPFVFPPQSFTVSSKGGRIIVESHPTDAWPQILIELSPSSQGTPTVQRVQFRPSGNTVESEILYTRVHYTVSKLGSYLLASGITSDDEVVGISFNCQPLTHEQKSSILYRAKIARKLKFIERTFNLSEALPEDITPQHVQYIEAIFRGLTEGEFTTRGNAVTVFLRAADIDLDAPPFSEVGPFEYCLGNEQALLFQQHAPYKVLDVGRYFLKLQRALLANMTLLSRLRGGQDAWIRFEALDSQITYRYERYSRPERHRLVQKKLERFHHLLTSEEPSDLADTLLEPLISDVLTDEAIKIAVGWLEYHDFTDRFSPQEPIMDEARACWRVPIYIVYASGKGTPVGELLIDLKTGSIIDEPSPELMYQEGLALGEKILRVG